MRSSGLCVSVMCGADAQQSMEGRACGSMDGRQMMFDATSNALSIIDINSSTLSLLDLFENCSFRAPALSLMLVINSLSPSLPLQKPAPPQITAGKGIH